ncbi:SAM-dependent methyltransferase [Halalkalibacter lacteus]|uniref:SAM-dependent methyltransferase n=1 Tax=Halalkalibacter lacteus TaxID=3090663 RepID=UPI002FCB0A46
MKEYFYDKLLNIETKGVQKELNKIVHYNRYEPTPYSALEKLFAKYELKSSDRLIDFGCGKGRLPFYINYYFNASAVGIEMNGTFYQEAIENQERYLKKRKNDNIHFFYGLAEEYEIDPRDNRFYFFNPFSVQIFMKVINNILLSVEASERQIELIIYYGSDEYVHYLETKTAFELKEDITLFNGYDQDPFERFFIYELAH